MPKIKKSLEEKLQEMRDHTIISSCLNLKKWDSESRWDLGNLQFGDYLEEGILSFDIEKCQMEFELDIVDFEKKLYLSYSNELRAKLSFSHLGKKYSGNMVDLEVAPLGWWDDIQCWTLFRISEE